MIAGVLTGGLERRFEPQHTVTMTLEDSDPFGFIKVDEVPVAGPCSKDREPEHEHRRHPEPEQEPAEPSALLGGGDRRVGFTVIQRRCVD